MVSARIPTKEELTTALRKYDRAVHDESVPEFEMDRALDDLVSLVPHSYISDLLHWGERKRTDEEAVEEAILRERIWRDEGDLALYRHMEAQLTSALDDPNLTGRQRYYCESTLEHIREKMGEIRLH